MEDKDRSVFDAKREAIIIERKAFDDADKKAAGYAEMDNDKKAIFDAELLKWKTRVYEDCEANEYSIKCRKATDIRTTQEEVRRANDYYNKSTSDREALDFAQQDADQQKIAALTAAWINENKPKSGKPGSECSAAEKCAGIDHCCGTATPANNAPGVTIGQRDGVCASKTDRRFTDSLGMEFAHVCGAQKLVAAVASILAATYLM